MSSFKGLLSSHDNWLGRDCAPNLLQVLLCPLFDLFCNSCLWHDGGPILLRVLVLDAAAWLLSSGIMHHLTNEWPSGPHFNLPGGIVHNLSIVQCLLEQKVYYDEPSNHTVC